MVQPDRPQEHTRQSLPDAPGSTRPAGPPGHEILTTVRPAGVRRAELDAAQARRRTPPPRPAVAADPVSGAQAVAPSRPLAVRASAALFLAASAAGLFAIVAAMVDGDALWNTLTVIATESNPTASAASISESVRVTILLVLGTAAGLALVTLLATFLLLRRRAWSRWLLLGGGVLSLLVADLGQSLVAGSRDWDRLGFVVQATLIVPALVLLLFRSSRRWPRPDSG